MGELNFKHYTCSYQLKQITPMIHFQHSEEGATLRASEIKPKLDKFILEKLGGFEQVQECHPDWVDSEHKSLNYKVQILSSNLNSHIEIANGKMFFGNQGVPRQEMKKTVFTNNLITVKFICNKKNLLEMLKNYVDMFFATINFGMCQSKGYGSFLTKKEDGSDWTQDEYESLLPNKESWKIELGNQSTGSVTSPTDIFNKRAVDIFWIYALMKSGLNRPLYYRGYIFKYMHESPRNIGNEKAYIKSKYEWAKKSGSNPKRLHHSNGSNPPHYVRALLGATEYFEFDTDPPGHRREYLRKVFVKGKNVERVQSPIRFRILGDFLYLIAQSIPSDLLGQKFQLNDEKIKEFNSLGNVISVPNEFDLTDFLTNFSEYFNRTISADDRQNIRASFFADDEVKGLSKDQKRAYKDLKLPISRQWPELQMIKIGEAKNA